MDRQYLTIRQTARELKIPEKFIRNEVKRGAAPGFMSGSRCYIDVTAFRDVLRRANLRADVQ